MAEITRRRTGELLRELFAILIAAPEGLRAGEALQQLESRVELTPYESGHFESGGRRFEKIVRFASVDCVKAGWLLKDKGIWSVTEEGREAYATLKEPEAFYRRATKLYAEWRASQPDADIASADVSPTSERGTHRQGRKRHVRASGGAGVERDLQLPKRHEPL